MIVNNYYAVAAHGHKRCSVNHNGETTAAVDGLMFFFARLFSILLSGDARFMYSSNGTPLSRSRAAGKQNSGFYRSQVHIFYYTILGIIGIA